MPSPDTIYNTLRSLTDSLVSELSELDPSASRVTDQWKRAQGGGGEANVFSGGELLEKGGVNFSRVSGKSLPASATKSRPELKDRAFEAMGVSVVFHPRNPYVPTTHMNVRFFTTVDKDSKPVWWFGGGFDLTPYYPYREDAVEWHRRAKEVCDPFGEDLYPEFKANCDQYFHLPHRNETRGVGGLFFDDFNRFDFQTCASLTEAVGRAFFPAWKTIVDRRKDQSYGEPEKAFQNYRRGRYVEFNLLYDRGTLFGLQSGGRTESILMSLPPTVQWDYNWSPQQGSHEAKLYETFLKPQDWLNFSENESS